MIQKIKNFIKLKLGIIELTNKISVLEKQNYKLKSYNEELHRKFTVLYNISLEVSQDNRTIKNHLNFLNSQFIVTSDISADHKYDPSVVLIMKRGKEDIVKTYTFNNQHTLEEIYHILEGFGKHNNIIDKPKFYPSPRFRY